MTSTGWIATIVALLIIIGLGWWFFARPASAPAPTQTSTAAESTSTTTAADTAGTSTPAVTVTYTDQGFSPATVTVAAGTAVTFVNQSSNPMWVASNPHPVHTGYDGTTEQQHCAAGYGGPAPFDECTTVDKGGSFTFTFTKVGSWGYHNHALHSDTGTVVVQ